MHFLIYSRAYVAQRSMPAFAIVEQLNVLKNILFSIGASFVYLVFDPLILQAAEEAFDKRIVPAIALSCSCCKQSCALSADPGSRLLHIGLLDHYDESSPYLDHDAVWPSPI